MIVNKYKMREQNVSVVLSCIIETNGISRADISKKTGLNKTTVSEIVGNLLNDGYVLETGEGSSSPAGGRKPIFLVLNPNYGFSISIDVGVNYITSISTLLDGTIVQRIDMENISTNSKKISSQIQDIVSKHAYNTTKTKHGVLGLAIGIHGVVYENTINFSPYYDLDQIDLYNGLSKLYDFPIFIENEANLSVLAEQSFSNTSENIITVSIHSGFGSGILLDNEIYRGKDGYSGEIGHTILFPNGINCPCGNKGCLEQYASERAIIHEHKRVLGREIEFEEIVEAYANGNSQTVNIVNQSAYYTSVGINNLLASFSPDAIYINSPMLSLFPGYFDIIKESINKKRIKNTIIEKSSLGQLSTAMGGAALVIKNFLNVHPIHFFTRQS